VVDGRQKKANGQLMERIKHQTLQKHKPRAFVVGCIALLAVSIRLIILLYIPVLIVLA